MASATDSLKNIGSNAIAPYSSGALIIGSIEYIALEVLVEMAIRMVIGGARRPLWALIAVHAVSLPMMGGFMGAFSQLADESAAFTTHLMDGAKSVLAVFAAQYVVGITSHGFYFPRLDLSDSMITFASKAITRPINATLAGYMPTTVRQSITALSSVIRLQQRQSSLAGSKILSG